MTDSSKVLQFIERAAARAEGREDSEPPPEAETLRYSRDRLSEAAGFAHAGAEVPADARLRPVKKALVAAVRPVTSNQGAFNEQMLAAVDGLAAVADRLSHQLLLGDQRTARLQAGIATTDLTVDDLSDDLRRMGDSVGDLTTAVESLRAEVASFQSTEIAALRSDLSVLQAKFDLVLRHGSGPIAAPAPPAGHDPAAAGDLDPAVDDVRAQLSASTSGSRDDVRARLDAFVADIESAAGSGPVLDLAPSRGEWLEALRDHSIHAYGVDTTGRVIDEASARGLDVRRDDPLGHLRSVPEGSLRAVTAFGLVPRLGFEQLLELVDAALVALAPGGLLVVSAPNPTNLIVGAAEIWRAPEVTRPVHPDLVELLVLARGFTEVEVRYGDDPAVADLRVDDIASADEDPARVRAVVDRVNWALGGPREFAVLARKARPAT